MNKDQVQGAVKEAAGKVQKKFGDVVDSREQHIKGAVRQAQGKAQQVRGDTQELVKDLAPKV
jgi:uncharacterized protein YjbJ (UPF0337 family)